MFRSELSGRHSNSWEFIVQNAKLEAFMLNEDICINRLAEMAKVSVPCMRTYLETGKHNKAYKALVERFPSLMK